MSVQSDTMRDSRSTVNIDRWSLAHGLFSYTLAENWSAQPVDTFRQGFYLSDAGTWLDVQVPGHWQQHPAMSDHAGRVVYRCLFDRPRIDGNSHIDPDTLCVWLRANGIFYWSQPYLNGTPLERHEGYFAPYEHDVTSLLHRDFENTLLVEVECPDEHNKFNKRMITGVFSHWDCFDPLANPGGIWLPMELHYSGPVRLQAVRCHSESFDSDLAQIRYTAELDAALAGPVVLRWRIEPRTFAGPIQTIEQRRTLQAGTQTISGLFKLRDPRLWWTHDLGRPDLYTVTLEVLMHGAVSDHYSFVFGVRRFELREWIPYLNGERFLIKGNNYAPGDMRIATMTSERCNDDLQLARACNMNFLRIHAHVDHPAFYQAADEAGMLLWQDMPLQWLYRAEVLPAAQEQVRQMVRLLYNHPSVAIWCMHNEPVFVADTADESLSTRLRTYSTSFGFSWNRNVMDVELKRLAEQEDTQRPVVRSSGEFNVPYFKEGTDAHIYFGWYSSYGTLTQADGMIKRLIRNLRFVTEFGAQSFPNVESSTRFMAANIEEIDFDHLARRHGFQDNVMEKWIPWREASSLAELVQMTQDYQIFVNRFYIDRLRFLKYQPTGGIVPFVFADPYPAVLWSVVDYWRVPKRSYYAMQMAFNPQYAFALFSPRTYRIAEPVDLPIYAVNDARHAVQNMCLIVKLENPDGDQLAVLEHTISLEADCLAQEIDRLRLTPTMPGQYRLSLSLTNVEQETHQVYHIHVL